MRGKRVYAVARRTPHKALQPGSLELAVFDVMLTLKRADAAKVVAVVGRRRDVRKHYAGRPKRLADQVYWFLWNFKKHGVLRQLPDRRFRGSRVTA